MKSGILYPKPVELSLMPIEVGVLVMIVAWFLTVFIAYQNNRLLKKLIQKLDCIAPP